MRWLEKFERKFDKFDVIWATLPIIRNSGRLQAFPFVAVILSFYLLLGLGLTFVIEAVGESWSNKSKAGVYAAAFVLTFFAAIMSILVRAARRKTFDKGQGK